MSEREPKPNSLLDKNGREFKVGSNVRLSELGRTIIKPPPEAPNLRAIVTGIDVNKGLIRLKISDLNVAKIALGETFGFKWGPGAYKAEWLIIED